jgi:hypothetical protein
VESAEQSVLDASEKYINIDKVIDGVRKTADRGIKVHLTFTFGLPGDTIETIEKTIDLACDLPCDTVQFSIATPYPGTKMYDMYKEAGWLQSENWEDYVGSTKAVSRTENFTGEQLEFYVEEAYRRFHLSRVKRNFTERGYGQNLLKALQARTVDSSREIVVLQCANMNFTHFIIESLLAEGYQVRLITHNRFVENFSDMLSPEHIVQFDNPMDFRFAELETLFTSVINDKSFIVAPCSNDNGVGYDEVHALLNLFDSSNSLMFGIEGRVI